MAYTVAVFGASGSGKSSLMQLLAEAGNQYSIHIKYTTRPGRTYDGVEIRCIDPFEQANYDYVYSSYGHRYGLQRKQIDEALAAGRHHFIICNDVAVLRGLQRDYESQFRAIFLTFDAPRQTLEEIQRERNITDDDISLRLAKIDALNQTFIEEYELFDAVVVNHYGAPLSSLRTQIEKLLVRFTKEARLDTELITHTLHDIVERLQRVQAESARTPASSSSSQLKRLGEVRHKPKNNRGPRMKNLFLVDGASATGKSDLLKWVMENNANDVSFVVKGTTRAQREYERDDPEILLDLEFLTDHEFHSKNYDYSYTYGGGRYGFFRDDLTKELLLRENVFVIVRNNAIISRVAKDYSFINVVPVFVYTDKAELISRLESANMDAHLIAPRIERSEIALRDYYAHPEVYREVLINNSSRQVFHTTIERLITKYGNQPSIDPYQVAVMMSFNPSNKKLDDYYDAMEVAVSSVSSNLKCKRVDKVPGSPKIAAEFRNLIASARCVIVDLTENKQNVYYELGFAQARGKTCLITAEEGTTPFFYPREHRIIMYDSARDLREKLSEELRGVLRGVPGI